MDETSILTQMETVLRKEREEYQTLLAFSEQQLSMLMEAEPNVEGIALLMDRKIQTMQAIQELDPGYRAIKERWEQHYLTFTPEQRQPVADLKASLLLLLEQLKDLEDQITLRIQKCEKEISQQLKKMYQGRSANQAYFKFQQGPPRYIDKKK